MGRISGSILAKELIRTVLERSRQNESFFESDEFNHLVELIRTEKTLNEGDLMYGAKKIEGLSYSSFSQVCNSVFHVLDSQKASPELGHYVIDYRDLRFNLLIGQGATYWTEKI